MFGDVMRAVRDQLRAGGVRAAIDPADLNPPAVWITPATAARDTLAMTDRLVTLDLYLVASGDPSAAVHALDELAARTTAAGLPVREVEAVTVILPNHNPAGLPAYRTTAQLRIEETP